LNQTLSHEDSEEIGKGINVVSNERLNEYELGFGSGLSPNGSDVRYRVGLSLMGRIQLRYAVHAHEPLGCIAGRLGRAHAGRLSQIQPNKLGKIVTPFSFSNLFYKFQTNSNSNQI
jgi:hypothetical protein